MFPHRYVVCVQNGKTIMWHPHSCFIFGSKPNTFYIKLTEYYFYKKKFFPFWTNVKCYTSSFLISAFFINFVIRYICEVWDLPDAVAASEELIRCSFFLLQNLHTFKIHTHTHVNMKIIKCDEVRHCSHMNKFSKRVQLLSK